MTIQIQVDFDAFWNSFKKDIDSSRSYIYIQTYSLEGDLIGRTLSDLLIGSATCDKRTLADTLTKYVLSDKFIYSPANLFNQVLQQELKETTRMISDIEDAGIQVRFTNPIRMSIRSLGRNHKKLIVIDDKVSYIGGINFSDHNSSWHDMMIRIEDNGVAEFLRNDFLASWEGRNLCGDGIYGEIELLTLDGRSNSSALERVFHLIDAAQSSITVISPYITHPFYEYLHNARGRGVSVEVITPEFN